MTVKTASPTHTFVYDTYIRTSAQALWDALTLGDFSEKYWKGFRIALEPRVGGTIRITPPKGTDPVWNDAGKVLAWDPLRKLTYEFSVKDPDDVAAKRNGPSRVTYELTPMGDMVRLRLIHENLIADDTDMDLNSTRGINNGWPAILSSLKSLLETGTAIPLAACSSH